jgi:hypothetical protein
MKATVDRSRHIQDVEETTVYMADSVIRTESCELDTGLTMLRQKLAGKCQCPACGETVEESFSDHYRDNRTCREAERV